MMPTISFNIERWKWSEEYRVYVSTEGRLRKKDGTDIRLKIDKHGYMRYHNKAVHRIVMETWRPCENMEKLTVDHLDHNKRKNSLKNLEWVSEKENIRRAKEDLDLTIKVIDFDNYDKIIYRIEGIDFTEEQAKLVLVPPGTPHPNEWFNKYIKSKLERKPKRKVSGRIVEVIVK